MSLTVSGALLAQTKHVDQYLKWFRKMSDDAKDDREFVLDPSQLTVEALQDVRQAALAVSDGKTARAVEALLAARQGKFDKSIPNFKGFSGILQDFLSHSLIDGWIYVESPGGHLYPELVTEITYQDGKDFRRGREIPSVTLKTVATGRCQDHRGGKSVGVVRNAYVFTPEMVTRKKVGDALAEEGLYKETPQLKEAYQAAMVDYEAKRGAFAKQFRAHGVCIGKEGEHYYRDYEDLGGRRVVADLADSDFAPQRLSEESVLLPEEAGTVPVQPILRVFDLKKHELLWVHAQDLRPHQYDKSLRDKLVLPKSHRDLLDIMTTRLDVFIDDIIEGKSAGNVILCRGVPGVGKTLTAEVYAELIEKPLYKVQAGLLGSTAEEVEKNLEDVLERIQRYGAVGLIDEADVYVHSRGQSLERDAIVSVFLRAMEYFPGLLFMTTNRGDEVDSAFLPRCAAVINYDLPEREDLIKIWRVMASQFKAEFPEGLVESLVAAAPSIAPRDIKMLLRLALRVASASGEPLTLEVFRGCAMFRAIDFKTPDAPSN